MPSIHPWQKPNMRTKTTLAAQRCAPTKAPSAEMPYMPRKIKCCQARSAEGKQLKACQVQSIRLISTDALDVQPEGPVPACPRLGTLRAGMHHFAGVSGSWLHACQHHGTHWTRNAGVLGKATSQASVVNNVQKRIRCLPNIACQNCIVKNIEKNLDWCTRQNVI